MHITGDGGKPFGAVIDRVHRGDDRQQHLRRADVRGRFLAANMLLTGLQGQTIGRLAAGIDGNTDEAARNRTFIGIADGHIGGMRTAVAHRNTEALGRSDSHVGTEFARGGQQCQRQRIGGHDAERSGSFQTGDGRTEITDFTIGSRILENGAEHIGRFQIGVRIADDQLPAERLGTGAQHSDGLRVAVFINEEFTGFRFRNTLGDRHSLGSRGTFVQQRGVGNIQAGQFADHGLEVQQRLETTLRNFRLIRRVGRVPGRIFENIAQNYQRRQRAGVALSDQRGEYRVLRSQLAKAGQGFDFGECPPHAAQRLQNADGFRQCFRNQGFHAADTEGIEHLLDFMRRRTDMTGGEITGNVRKRQSVRIGHDSSLSRRASETGHQPVRHRRPLCLFA